MESMFQSNVPIYLQIIAELKRRIAAGELLPGGRVASVREMAAAFGVNPNTMQRALTELERENLLHTERTAGRFVTTDEELISMARAELAQTYIEEFLRAMRGLGVTGEPVLELVRCAQEKESGGTKQ